MIKHNTMFTVNYMASAQKTTNFWESLNVEILEHREDKVVINLSDFEFHYVLDSTEPFETYQFASKSEGRGHGTLFYFEVEDLQKFYNLVSSQNPNIITDIADNLWEGREFLFSDPDGFLFVAFEMKSGIESAY